MPTKREREYYQLGFRDGMRMTAAPGTLERDIDFRQLPAYVDKLPKRKRKLSAWNKYVKNKRNHITYRDGKLNLKKMAVAFRRKKRR